MNWTLKNLIRHSTECHAKINGKWVPARPVRGPLISRARAALAVLTGKADAVTWPEGQ